MIQAYLKIRRADGADLHRTQVSLFIFLTGCLTSVLVWSGGLAAWPLLALVGGAVTLLVVSAVGHPSRWVLTGILLVALLDPPGTRSFYEFTAITEVFGEIWFERLSVLGIPGLAFSLFEVCLGAGFLIGCFNRSKLKEKTFLFLLGGVGIAAAVGAIIGLGAGGTTVFALRQMRPGMVFLLAACFGASGALEVRWLPKVLIFLWASALLRSLTGLWVYFTSWGGSLGEREYLIDHMSSDLLVTGVLAGAIWVKNTWTEVRRVGWCGRIYFLSLPFIGLTYALNDRRASLVGLLAAAVVLAFLWHRRLWPRFRKQSLWCVGVFVLFIGTTWTVPGPLGFVGRTMRSFVLSDSSVDYRTIENMNISHALAENPLWGYGFGRRLEIVSPLPDISFLFSDFDLIPHNSLLALWAFGGPLLAASFAVLIVFSLGKAAKVMLISGDRWVGGFGLLALTGIIRWVVYSAFDMGLFDFRLMALNGLFIGAIWHFGQKES